MASYITVSTISPSEPRTGGRGDVVERNLEVSIDLLEQALLDMPDIICLTERFNTMGLPLKEALERAETLDGPTLGMIREVAKKGRVIVVCPMLIKEDDRIFNSAIIVDRSGDVAGIYRKIHPTISELEAGISPGTSYGIFDTDLGRIGVAICFDLNFGHIFREFRRSRVRLFLFPSAYPGGLLLRLRALEGKFYVASAVWGARGTIVDPLSRTVGDASEYCQVISARINLDFEILHLDYNYEKFRLIKEKYGREVKTIISRPEAYCLIISEGERRIDEIMIEFGLEERDDYLGRSNELREKALREGSRG